MHNNQITENVNKIESYFIELNLAFKQIAENLWSISDESIDNIIISYEDPIIIIRLKLMQVPKKNKESFFETLLKLNVNSLIHGAYGIENDSVVLVDSLQIINLDLNELQASLEAIKLSVISDYPLLHKFQDKIK